MGNDSLFLTHGAQPAKPSRYKPIWNDRFFTGYFTNRSPLRSPLSAFYADGWNLGKTDTLIDGLNVEISPRLTLIRRPGSLAFTSVNLPNPASTFYSFHRQDGTITLIADTSIGVYTVTPSAITSIYTKLTGASQSVFAGLGNQLYWGDGTACKAWDATNPAVAPRQMGITAPAQYEGLSAIFAAKGTAINLPGFKPGTGYVSTTTSQSNPSAFSAEAWINCGASAGPILSFESAQTGASATVFHTLYLDPTTSFLSYAVRDGVTGLMNITNTGITISDNNWHQVFITFKNTGSIFQSVSSVNGLSNTSVAAGSQNFTQDPKVTTNWSYNTTPTFSSSPAPQFTQVCIYIDGQLVLTAYPQLGSLPVGTGWWRIGRTSGWTGISASSFTGTISEVSIYNTQLAGQGDHFATMSVVGPALVNYENRITSFFPAFWWKLQEPSGTVAADSSGNGNTGTYQTGVTLNQAAVIPYILYAASTGYTVGKFIVDSNGNLQKCTTAGTTAAAAPGWLTLSGQTTTDGSVIWTNQGPAALNLTVGRRYAYAYGNKYGHFSTLSPLGPITRPMTGGAPNVIGVFSNDTQVTQVAIFAVPDGGVTPFYVASIPQPSGVGGAQWGFTDTVPDSQLNILMAGPQAHSNDAPPPTLTNLVYHLGRLWGSVGNTVYASGGPDTLVGNGFEAWPPANSWSFPAQVTRLVTTNSGLLVLTTSGIQLIAGGPSISQFYPQQIVEKVGLASWNALDTNGSQITLFTSDRQLLTIDSNTGITDIGFPIGDKLATLNPTSVYVVHHHAGLDNGLYLGDGSTGWYRCVPMQPPDFSITGPVWSPKATVNGGNCGAIATIETSPGVYQLMVSDTRTAHPILVRDSTYGTFSDNGASYTANFTVGSVVLANPGELAELGFITADFIRVGTSPVLSVLLDEVTGTFSNISGYVVSDPPMLYGPSGAPASLYSNRYYLKQTVASTTPPPAWCRHLQINVSFGTDTVMNEILSSTIYGSILVEGT